MKNFSNEEVFLDKRKKSIFLAGPTKRNSNFYHSWRFSACNFLENLDNNLIIYIPEYINEPFDEQYVEKQCLWERKALENADCILFWIDRQIQNNMPAFTTNVEFGTFLQIKPNQIVYGRPDSADKMRYLDWLYKYERGSDVIIYNDFNKALKAAYEKADLMLKKRL